MEDFKEYKSSILTEKENIVKSQYSFLDDYIEHSHINQTKDLKVVSLFSGCGGMDLGFEGGFIAHRKCIPNDWADSYIDESIDPNWIKLKESRFKLVFANDILKEAATAWLNNFPKMGYSKDIFHFESIVDLVKRHKAGQNIFPKNVDVVTGGFPCQDFSVAGKRKGFASHKDHQGKVASETLANEETRGKLYIWMKEVIEITKPKVFIAENVKGLVNLENVKEIIRNDFASAGDDGYIVLEPQVLHAANYGVPQSRERVIFIGLKKSALKKSALEILSRNKIPKEYSPYPLPTHTFARTNGCIDDVVTLSDVFRGLPEPEESSDLSHKFFSKAKFMGTHCQGQKEVNMAGLGPTIRAEHHGNIEYRRLSQDKGGINEPLLQERRLSPRECALIQSFPIDFEFVKESKTRKNSYELSPSGAYKVIGNAVPPLLAFHIAKRLEALWNIYFKK